MAEPQTHEALLTLLNALVDEIKSAAHDPVVVHMVADKIKHGIDSLEHALTDIEHTAKSPDTNAR